MGVSIYYTAFRDRPLSDGERERIQRTLDRENTELLQELARRLPAWRENGVVPPLIEEPGEICEGLSVSPSEGPVEGPGEVLWGSSKLSHSQCGEEPMLLQLRHYLESGLGALRLALPDAEWRAHVEDVELVWDEEAGEYTFPGS